MYVRVYIYILFPLSEIWKEASHLACSSSVTEPPPVSPSASVHLSARASRRNPTPGARLSRLLVTSSRRGLADGVTAWRLRVPDYLWRFFLGGGRGAWCWDLFFLFFIVPEGLMVRHFLCLKLRLFLYLRFDVKIFFFLFLSWCILWLPRTGVLVMGVAVRHMISISKEMWQEGVDVSEAVANLNKGNSFGDGSIV